MENFSLIRRISQLGTVLQTVFFGVKVGEDRFGNVYYHSRRAEKGVRQKRWVMFAGEPEASKIPPEWHIWLHYTADAPLAATSTFHKPWQLPYESNKTGTVDAYLPPGHTLLNSKRAKATGDYEAWTPKP